MIYDNAFSGRMRGVPEFESWIVDAYWRRYPSPPRGNKELERQRAADYGLALEGKEDYANEATMSSEELVSYLLTQSNVIAAVEGGEEKIKDVAAWLTQSVLPFFGGEPRSIAFGGRITYFRKLEVD